MQKKFTYIVIFFLGTLIFWSFFQHATTKKVEITNNIESVLTPTPTVVFTSPKVSTASKVKSVPLLKKDENQIQVALKVGQNSYHAEVPKDSSVYEAMKIFANETAFRFQGEMYSGLGFFVKDINGVANAGGTYWTLYMNGMYSQVGASDFILKYGDEVEWKYEKK